MIARLAAGLVGLAVLVPAVVFGGPIAVHALVPIAMAICLYEYARMTFPTRWVGAFGWLIGATVLPYATALYVGFDAAWVVWGLVVVATSTRVVLRPDESLDAAFSGLARYIFGSAWIGLLVFLPLLRDLPDGLGWVFLALGLAWLSDTGAYFAGRAFGRTKLHETLSPKKTVEGYIGGMVTATLGAGFFAWLLIPALNVADVLILGVGVGTLGVVGDLAESLVKRATGVKDAGSIMPGHGGLLDRVDSLLFVVPALYGYASLVKGLAA